MSLFRRRSEPEPEQSDADFVAACGYSADPKAAELAAKLRRELARLMGIRHLALIASSRFVDTGVFDPHDSLNLLDFSLELEHALGPGISQEAIASVLIPDKFENGAYQPRKKLPVESLPEFLTIAEWTRRLVELAREHGAI